MKVFITRQFPGDGAQLLKDAGFDVETNPNNKTLTKKELVVALKSGQHNALLCMLTNAVDADVLSASQNLKIVANYAVGYDNVDTEAAKKARITVTNTPDVLTNAVAEHTVALMLAITQRIVEADAFTRVGKYTQWEPDLLLGMELEGKTLGLVGAGRIGTRTAQIAHKGLGMKIAYHDIKQSGVCEDECDATLYEKLEDLLAVSDVVSLHLPLTDDTHHLINKNALSHMKKSAYLINTARGPVVEEAALVAVLKEGSIAGAALDVFENEPKFAPGLVELSNVVLTPHIGSATEETRGKMGETAAQSIIDVLNGTEPKYKVV